MGLYKYILFGMNVSSNVVDKCYSKDWSKLVLHHLYLTEVCFYHFYLNIFLVVPSNFIVSGINSSRHHPMVFWI